MSRRGQERRCPAALAARRVAGRDDAPDASEGCRDFGRRQLGGLIAGLGVVLGVVFGIRAIVGTDPTVQFSGYLLVLALLWIGARLVGGGS